MKCPRCKREIAFAAMEHPACGWVLPSRSSAIPFVKSAAGEKALAEMRAMLRKRVMKIEERRAAEKIPGVEVTPGHGGSCTCEVCFPRRLKPNAARAKLLALAQRLKGGVT